MPAIDPSQFARVAAALRRAIGVRARARASTGYEVALSPAARALLAPAFGAAFGAPDPLTARQVGAAPRSVPGQRRRGRTPSPALVARPALCAAPSDAELCAIGSLLVAVANGPEDVEDWLATLYQPGDAATGARR